MNSFSRINRSALSELTVHRKSHIISMIFLGIAGLLYSGSIMYYSHTVEPNGVSLFFFFVALFPLLSSCVSVFKDMHDVPSADVQMAMPLSAKERFFSRLLTICYIWIFPYIFFHGVGNALSIVLNIVEKMNYSGEQSYYAEPAPAPELFAANMKIFLWGLSIVLFITASVVLCACCIGSKAETSYLPVILMIVVSVLPFETRAFVRDKFANVNLYGDTPDFINIFGFGAVFLDIDEGISVLYVLLNCLISVAMIFAAMYAYVKRDATTVGYPIVYRWFFEALMIFSLAALFQVAHESYGLSYIGMFIIFTGSLVLRMVVSRKDITFAKVLKWSGIFAAYYTVFLVFSYIACITGGFGMNDYLPETAGISPYSAVTINYRYNKLYREYDYITHMYYDDNDYSVTLDKTISFENLDDAAAVFAKYADVQNRTPGFFSYAMFRSGDNYRNWYRCTLEISGTRIGKDYTNTLYDSTLYLDEQKAASLYEELNSLK